MDLFNKALVSILPVFPKKMIFHYARNYIAGPEKKDALSTVAKLNERKIMATVDFLGENLKNINDAQNILKEYTELLQAINERKLNANISVKLTNLGLQLDREKCLENAYTLAETAKNFGNFMRIDMEDSSVTTDTIDIFIKLKDEFGSRYVGVAIQAYLWRTARDIERLIMRMPNIRLCKGIYNESPEIAFKDMRAINKNYDMILERLLSEGAYVGIATHDVERIAVAMNLVRKYKAEKNSEFQMLLGVGGQYLKNLVREGYRARVYVPYGKDWYGYCLRRFKENPRLIEYVFKNTFLKEPATADVFPPDTFDRA